MKWINHRRPIMKTRSVILACDNGFAARGTALAQTTTNTNTQTNRGSRFGGNFGGVGNSSFSFTSGNSTISLSTGADGSFCQFFSLSAGVNSIVQILTGNSMTQTFGSSDPVADPCQ